MSNSALCPPNSQWLSDNVISAVVECSRPSAHDRFADLTESVQATDQPADNSMIPERSVELDPIPVSTSRPIDTSHAHRGKTRLKQDDAPTKLKQHWERRRLTQIRYRKKIQNHTAILEEEVRQLREEIHNLELEYRAMAPRLIEDMTPWNVVAEYFRLFRYALTAYVPISERSNPFASLDMYESRMHHDFLKTAFAPDVIVDNDQGVDVLLKCWRFISISQPNYDVQVVHLENGPGGVVVAKTKIGIVMCDNMLHFTYPHLAKSGRGRYLATKHRGQRFEIAGSTVFGWDNEKRCMSSLYNKSDPLTPILGFLGSMEDMAFVFDKDFATIEGRMILSPSA